MLFRQYYYEQHQNEPLSLDFQATLKIINNNQSSMINTNKNVPRALKVPLNQTTRF